MSKYATGPKCGRSFSMKEFELFQVETGVVDINNPKSIYLDIKGHVTLGYGRYPHLLRKFNSGLENVVKRHLDTVLFSDKVIYAPLIPETMAILGKGFVNLSFNLFVKEVSHFNEKHYGMKVQTLLEEVEEFIRSQQEFYTFEKKKSGFKKK